MPLIEPHKIRSRTVEESDLERVMTASQEMFSLCWKGTEQVAFAIAHPQITSEDPLRFFVLSDGSLIINPVIVNKTKVPVVRYEGCMTFPGRVWNKVMRSNKLVVKYSTIDDGVLQQLEEENVIGIKAQIIQHEIDHFDGIYVYEDEEVAESN